MIATYNSLQQILQSNIEALKGAACVTAPFMLLRIRFGPFAACLSLSLTTCLCCTVTAVIAGWQIGLWRGANRYRAAAADPKVHSEASNSSCAGQ
jgi:preprotein translocase subunit SecD